MRPLKQLVAVAAVPFVGRRGARPDATATFSP